MGSGEQIGTDALPGTHTENMGFISHPTQLIHISPDTTDQLPAAQSGRHSASLFLTESGVEMDNRWDCEEFPGLPHSPGRYSCQVGVHGLPVDGTRTWWQSHGGGPEKQAKYMHATEASVQRGN